MSSTPKSTISPLAAGIGLTAAALFMIGGAFLGQALHPEPAHSASPSTVVVGTSRFDEPVPVNPVDEIQLPELDPLPEPITQEFPETTIPRIIEEDDPEWDCRTMGNQKCGVEIEGTWYVLDFATGTFQ